MIRKTTILLVTFIMVLFLSPISKVLKATAQVVTEEKQIYVKVLKPFVLDKDRNTSAEFVNLPQEAIDFGLENMKLNGQISPIKEGNKVTANIAWTSITASGSEQLTKTLRTPLRSKISGKIGEMVNVGEQFMAKGDLSQLAEKLIKLDEEVKEASKAVSEKTTEKTSTVAGLQPASGSTGGTSGSISPNSEWNAAVTESDSVTYEDCEPAADMENLVVYNQQREITTDANGNTSKGLCANTGQPMPILSRDGSCSFRIDWNQKRAIKQEQFYYLNKAGQEISVGTCRDSSVAYPLEQFPSTCETLMVDGKAIEQTRWGYNVNGNIVYVTDCVPSGEMDAVSTTYTLCPDILNYNTKLLTKQRQTNVVGASGRVYSSSSCETYETYSLIKDIYTCGIRLDLPNMQAIDQQRWYYYDNSGNEVPIGDCADSTDVYPIQKYYDQCPPEVDVENRVAKKFYKLGYMKNGIIHYIDECQLDSEQMPLVAEYQESEPDFDFLNLQIWKKHKLILKDSQGNVHFTGTSERYGDPKPILSKDGDCEPRISFDQKIAVKKHQLYYMDDLGNEVLIGACIDSETTYPIVGYPNLCSPIIEDGKATETTKWGYDVNGHVTYVTDCITTGQSDNLSTRFEECPEVVDYNAKKLYKMRKSFLEGASGKVYQESECEIYETYSILSSEFTCGFRIDMDNKYAIKQEQWFYFNSKGEEILIGECRDSSDAYPIVKHYEQCEPSVDVENKKATLYYRWGYTYNGQVTYVTSCEAETEQIPLTENYIECDPEFDVAEKKAWKRRITLLVDSEGKEYHRSGCERFEEIPLFIEYENCADFIDESNSRVDKLRISIWKDADGKEYFRSLCEKYDEEPILTKDGSCSFRYDMENLKAIKTEQWYYVNDKGEEILIGACRDSATMFDIVEMSGICPNIEDIANGRVFPQTRLGFIYGSEPIYVTECQPQDGAEYVVYEEQCSDPETGEPLYTHDFVNNVSYPMVRKYYTQPTAPNVKIFLNECTKSSQISYPHKFETSNCGWVMDDENLQAQQLSTAFIETPSGNIVIQECAARTAPVPYAYVGTEDVVTEYPNIDTGSISEGYNAVVQYFTPPPGLTKIVVSLVGGGQNGSGSTTPSNCAGRKGGNSSIGYKDKVITFNEGEIIPFYTGRRGLYRRISAAVAYSQPGTESWIGDNESSFTPIHTGFANYRTGENGDCGGANQPYDGGDGADGWEWYGSPNASPGRSTGLSTGGKGGRGWGAGGGGSAIVGSPDYGATPGDGAPGYMKIVYRLQKYLRPDGSTYTLPYNGE